MTNKMVKINAVKDNKQDAIKFLRLVVKGDIEEAYEKYVDMKGKHHNAFFPAGFPALQKAMIESHVKFPKKQFLMKNVLGDDDLVAVHSHVILTPKEAGIAVVHLFRFKNKKIVEMWDCGQVIPSNSPNKEEMF